MNFIKALSLVLAVVVTLSGPVAVRAQTMESGTSAKAAEAPPAQEGVKDLSADAAYELGAGVATVVNIPLRGALCGFGGLVGFAVMVITFGSGYRAAAKVVEEGCSGPWIITPEHLKGTEPSKRGGYN